MPTNGKVTFINNSVHSQHLVNSADNEKMEPTNITDDNFTITNLYPQTESLLDATQRTAVSCKITVAGDYRHERYPVQKCRSSQIFGNTKDFARILPNWPKRPPKNGLRVFLCCFCKHWVLFFEPNNVMSHI